MSSTPARPRKPLGSRPPPSHSTSPLGTTQRGLGQSPAISLTQTAYLITPPLPDAASSLSTSNEDMSPPASLYPSIPPPLNPSRSTTPRPKLALPSLITGGGGAVGGIGANDPDFDSPQQANPVFSANMIPLSVHNSPPVADPWDSPAGITAYFSSTSLRGNHIPSPSLRPPPIGGSKTKLKPSLSGLSIPLSSKGVGAMGTDDPDVLDDSQAPALDLDDENGISALTIRPLHPQHERLNSIEELKRVITPSSATYPANANVPGASSSSSGNTGTGGGVTGATTNDWATGQYTPNTSSAHVPNPGSNGAFNSITESSQHPLAQTGSSASSTTTQQATQDEWEEADKNLEDVVKLGEGAGGEVYKVRDTKTGRLLARKIISSRSTPAKQLVRELNHMSKTDHPNIIKFWGAYISPSSGEVRVVMELGDGGSLEAISDRIKKLRGRVSEKVIGKVAEGIFSGLTYLHSLRIIHRDIKPSNILLSRTGVVKLCDFGVSGELVDSVAGTWTGTGFYMAPERISGGLYTMTSDVWSSGLTLLTFAQNRFPYPDDLNNIVDLVAYLAMEQPPGLEDEEGDETRSPVRWSDSMKDCIRVCLTRDGKERPSPSQVLQHPWLMESGKQKVDMARWIREVWGWDPPRGRPRPGDGLAAGDDASRRPSTVRGAGGGGDANDGRRDGSAVRMA